MSVADALHARRSVRAFRSDPVDADVLRAALAAAQRAPSGGNLQPWRAIILTGEPWERLKAVVGERLPLGAAGQQIEYAIYPEVLPDPWKARRFGVGEALYAALDIPRENKMGRMLQFAQNFQGFGAPVMLFLYTPRTMGPPQWSDMGMWLQSLMLLLDRGRARHLRAGMLGGLRRNHPPRTGHRRRPDAVLRPRHRPRRHRPSGQ